MKEGLYAVRFQTQMGAGDGIITLAAGKIRGGDSALFYVGSYVIENGELPAEVKTARYATNPAFVSVFGIDNADISLRGQASGDSATVIGTAKQALGVSFQASLRWLAD